MLKKLNDYLNATKTKYQQFNRRSGDFLGEVKANLEAEYKRFKRKRVKALPVIIIICLLVLSLIQAGNEYKSRENQYRVSNEKTTTTIDRLNDELNNLRNEVKQGRDEQTKTDQQLNNQIKDLQSRKEEKQRELAKVQSSERLASQRPVLTARGDIEAYVIAVFGANAHIALAIMQAESGGNPSAISSTLDYGVFQIHASSHPQWSIQQLLDYKTNINAAFVISSGGTNWRPWTTYTSGKYLRFL